MLPDWHCCQCWVCVIVCVCVCEPGIEARESPNMASEDVLEDLPGDQPLDSLVPTEQTDTESLVGNCSQQASTWPPCFFQSITVALLVSVGFLVRFL